MSVIELKETLDLLGVKAEQYSLNGVLAPEAIILCDNHLGWEVFYHNAKGKKDNHRYFSSESEACEHIRAHFAGLN